MTARPSKIIPQRTAEAFEITVSATGTDPAEGALYLTTQAESAAWGDFATIPGAVSAIPDQVEHDVTIALPTGLWVLDSRQFGETGRIRPTYYGRVQIAGVDGWTQAPGSPASMAVQSHTNGVVTLQSDPSLPAETYRGYYLLVLSGTGAGQYKPLRSYSGAQLVCAGSFSPMDATSVVQIVERATTIELDTAAVDFDGRLSHSNYWQFDFHRLNIIPPDGDAYAYFAMNNVTFGLTGGTRCVKMGAWLGMCNIVLEDVIFDTRGWISAGIAMQGGLVRVNWGSSRPFLLLGSNLAGYPAIALTGGLGSNNGVGAGASAFIFGKQAFDDWDTAFIQANYIGAVGQVQASGGFHPDTDQSADAAIVLSNGAQMAVDSLSGLDASTFKGSVTDVDLDGTALTWATIDGYTDKFAISSKGTNLVED